MRYDWSMNCFPLAGRKVLCADQSGRTFLFDANTRNVVAMPDLHKPKSLPMSIFVPSADADKDEHDDVGGSIFIMERFPNQEPRGCGQQSHQFEAFVYRKPTLTSFTKPWHCQLLPPPPFVCDPKYWHRPPKISSYAVVDGGSHICISVDGAGTYCLDTVKHTWRQVGEWTLPFEGKVEYVPELKLWFGLCAKDRQLAAADLSTILSTMDSQPQLVGTWKELEGPEEWREMQHPQLVNLGSGRFCIARFFLTRTQFGYFDDDLIEQFFVVLTGADVVRCVHNANGSASSNGSGNVNDGNGKVDLQIIKHNSRLHMSYGSNGTIKAVF